MPIDDLRFDIQEKPTWRTGPGTKTSSQLLKDIVEWKEKFTTLSKDELSSFEVSFQLCMNIEYVYHSNLAEGVGVQRYEEVKQTLERILGLGGNHADAEKTKEELETGNTAKGYIGLRNIHQQNGSNGKLFIKDLCDVHQLLMKELRTDAGKLRAHDAHLRLPNNSFQFYCKPEVAQARILGLVHQHNINVETFALGSTTWKTIDQYITLIKAAAWLLANFLEIHPFFDGNGRVGWLLANYCLSLLNPFPTHLYDFNGSDSTMRKSQFLGAMENFRKNPKEGPKEVAALILEGIWSGWNKFFKAFDVRKMASNTIYVVFQKSQVAELEQRVKEVQIAKHLGVSEAEAIAMVKEMVGRVNVASFQHQQYSQLKLDSVSSLNVYVRVFP